MQTTELDPTLSQTLAQARKPGLTLVIGNKNYSSWSMRPWVAMTAFGIPFEEIRILLDQPDTATSDRALFGRGPGAGAGRRRHHGLGFAGHLRIPGRAIPGQAPVAAGRDGARLARSICAEMHSGFTGLRTAMSMNIRASLPGKGRTPEAQADIGRMCEIWEMPVALRATHRFLFGDFSIADAYYAPVVMRFRPTGSRWRPRCRPTVDRVLAHPRRRGMDAAARWPKTECRNATHE